MNVTVNLPNDVLRKARHLAVDKGVSLSRYLAGLLQERVEADQRYRAARERQLSLMRKGLRLGLHDQTAWSRESLHER